MAVKTLEKTHVQKKKKVPKELIYEMRKGSPIYYRDYDKVLSGGKTLEEVMGSSGLQGFLLVLIASFLREKLKDNYFVLGGEVGYRFTQKSWYNLDIAVLPKDASVKLTDKYLDTPPEIVIEIDTKADLRKFENPQDYFHRKTQDLLDSGVKKVIWIFTQEKKLWIAEKGKPWLIVDWDYEFELMDGVKLNLLKLVKEEYQGKLNLTSGSG